MAERGPSWGRFGVETAIVWLLSFVLWICFTAKLAADELIVGAAACVVGTIGLLVFRRAVPITFRPRVVDLWQCWRIPQYMITGAVEIMQALGQQLFARQGASSLVRSVAFEGGTDDEAQARTVLAVTYTTITPNFIIVGVVPEEHRMIYHQILASDVLQITINLGARP